jgi:hypothetical protein
MGYEDENKHRGDRGGERVERVIKNNIFSKGMFHVKH